MTKRILLPVLLAPALVLALAGCVPLFGASAPGPQVSDDRGIDSVESVVVQTSGDLTVTVGDTASLRISAPANVIDRLTSDVVDGRLVLGMKGPQWSGGFGDIEYELIVPRLSEVSVEGSSDVHADFSGAADVVIRLDGSGDIEGSGIDSDSVTTSIDGSGDITLTGRTDTQSVEIDGSGNFAGDDLISRAARVSISGSADVGVNATETLDANISGVGDIHYSGGAVVTKDVSGSGSVVED